MQYYGLMGGFQEVVVEVASVPTEYGTQFHKYWLRHYQSIRTHKHNADDMSPLQQTS
jgi:hypothetical protein